MRLPTDWSGRYLYQGNGGLDGNVATALGRAGSESGLQLGFAVISSDAGHAGSMGPTFGIDPQARLDYGYQAVGTLTPMAKALIEAAYGKAPDRSYMTGGSNGGRHTMVGAARYADQYDGFLAVAPGFNLPQAAVAQLWGAQQWATRGHRRRGPQHGPDPRRATGDRGRHPRPVRWARPARGRHGPGQRALPEGLLHRSRRPDLRGRSGRHVPDRGAEGGRLRRLRRSTHERRRGDLQLVPVRSRAGPGQLGILEVLRVEEPRSRRRRIHLRDTAGSQHPRLAAHGRHRRRGAEHLRDERHLHRERHGVHDAAGSRRGSTRSASAAGR